MEILVKKSKLQVKNFSQKSKFWSKNGSVCQNNLNFRSKCLSKNRNFGQKSKFWSKMEILIKNGNFGQKVEMLVKNGNFGQKIVSLIEKQFFRNF